MNAVRLTLYPMLFLAALIGLLPGALLIGLIALILPGLILFVAPTAALYIPLIDALVTGLRRGWLWLWAPALFALPALALLLPMGAAVKLDDEVARLTAGDFASDPGGAPGRLLLYDYRRTQGSADGRYAGQWLHSASDGAACDETCARLLLGRQVEAIVRPIPGEGAGVLTLERGYAGRAMVYTYEPGDVCPDNGRYSPQLNRELLAMIGSGHCIVAREVYAPGFDAAVVGLVERLDFGRLDPAAPGIATTERQTVWRCGADGCRTTLVNTSIVAERMVAPLVIGVKNNSDKYMRRAVWRTPRTIRPLTRDELLARTLGLGPSTLPKVDPARLRAASERALAAAAAANRPLSDAERETVAATLKAIADGPSPSSDDLALLRVIALHPTADWLPNLEAVFRLHPEETAAVAETLIEGLSRITAREHPLRQNDLRRALARAIAGLPDEAFQAQGPAILRAAALPGAIEGAGPLITRLGDLGAPALPLLRARLADRKDLEAVAFGLCRMGSTAVGAAPDLVAAQRPSDRDRARTVAVALARIGRPDLIRRPTPEAYKNVNEAGERYDNAWFDAVPPTINPASPAEVCSSETVRNRRARQRL